MVERETNGGRSWAGVHPARRLPANPRAGSQLPNFAPLEPFIVLPVGSWSLILLSLAPEQRFFIVVSLFFCVLLLLVVAFCCVLPCHLQIHSIFWPRRGKRGYGGPPTGGKERA